VAVDSTAEEADSAVVVGSTVAGEADSMEEVVGLTVGKVTTMNSVSGQLQEARSGRLTRIHFGPSLGSTATWSELSPATAHSLYRVKHSFELPSYIRDRLVLLHESQGGK
jgi:hypothetical protein